MIWFTDARPFVAFDQTPEAFEVIDEWMANLRANPELGVAGNKPDAGAVDRCFDDARQRDRIRRRRLETAFSTTSRRGRARNRPSRLHRSTRIVAGGPIEGGIFKCATKSVAAAIVDGDYGSWVPSAAERTRLEEIFPDGVCDWSQADQGRPTP